MIDCICTSVRENSMKECMHLSLIAFNQTGKHDLKLSAICFLNSSIDWDYSTFDVAILFCIQNCFQCEGKKIQRNNCVLSKSISRTDSNRVQKKITFNFFISLGYQLLYVPAIPLSFRINPWNSSAICFRMQHIDWILNNIETV